MTAAAGDFVTPGSSVIVPDGVETGHGIHSDASGSMAVVTGTIVQSNDTISVDPSRPSVNSPQIGDVIIAEVNRLNPKTAEVRLLHIEGKDGGHRTVPAEELFADIFVTNFVDRFLPSAGDAMRKRDVVRARIVELDPMLKATTRDNPELGVLHALCPQCGEDLEASSKTPDFNVACPRCDYTGYRVLSNGFGHGHVLGDDIQSLNRPGARWSSEAEPMLGHDGARPYLSPVADYRRGMSHEMPDSVRRQRAAQSRGGGVGKSRTKIGDIVIVIISPGVPEIRIAIEAKSGSSIGRKELVRQTRDGVKMRGAVCGIGLMERKHMGVRQQVVEQEGENFIVGVDWDNQDFLALEVVYRTLRAQLIAEEIRSSGEDGIDVNSLKKHLTQAKTDLGLLQGLKGGARSAITTLEDLRNNLDLIEDKVKEQLSKAEDLL